MDTFVGAEYIIANALIVLSRKGKDCITFSELRSVGVQIQQYCNENNVDAVILTSGDSISNAIFDFSDYFEYVEPTPPHNEPMIRTRIGTPISRLEQRFVGYLPLDVAWVLITELPRVVNDMSL